MNGRLQFPCHRCTTDEKPGSRTRTICNGNCLMTREDTFELPQVTGETVSQNAPLSQMIVFEGNGPPDHPPYAPKPSTVLGTQVGGSHYTDCAIQPIEYIWANKLGFSEGNIVKYVTRWKAKGGIKDLEKAKHHIALLIEHEQKKAANAVS